MSKRILNSDWHPDSDVEGFWVAVLPFNHGGSNAELASLADGLTDDTITGLSKVQGATAQATSFRLGRYSIIAPTVSCCGASDATSMLIGNEVLRRFTVTFDYPSSRIFITPNAHFEKPLHPGTN